MNQQPISKQQLREDGTLDVHHLFATIQGEGPFVGTPAVFVRLYGCNLQCPMCDTEYTDSKFPLSPLGLVAAVNEMRGAANLVVITGGEPMRQNLGPALRALLGAGYRVQIETNGTLFVPDLPYDQITVVCSPKAGKVDARLLPHVAAFKYVLHADSVDPTDGLPIKALGHSVATRVARPPKDFKGVTFLQPVDLADPVENKRHLEATIRSCLKYGYTLCLQTHKIINME